MYRTVIFLPLLLASAALTVWELNSHDTKKTWEYVAYQSDGIDELQFYCDNVDPDDIQMLVVTSLDAEAGDDEFADVSVNALIDGVRFDDLSGYYDEVEGERTVVLETREEARVRDILDAAQAAS
jgi:hypothetical protein